jgi:outer membrane protein assembly factor BamA
MVKKYFWPFSFVLLLAPAVAAQFKIERVPNDFGYDLPQKFTLYTNTHFNRVEALYLNLGVKFQPQPEAKTGLASGLTLYGDAGYGFKNEKKKRARWTAGLQKNFLVPSRLTFGAEYFNKVETNDRWIVSEFENSLAGIFHHEDFMDFYSRKGGRGFLDYQLAEFHTLRLEVSNHRYDKLRRNSNWSLFGGDKIYPLNPRFFQPPKFDVVNGDEMSVKLTGAFDWRDNPVFPNVGWLMEGYFERTGNDFETNGLFLTVKRYQPTLSDQKLVAKFMFGSRSGSFAYQHLLTLGGLSSLRAYREKEFVGNRLLFANVNYAIGQRAFGGLLQKFPLLNKLPFWETISLGFFAETGYAWFADPLDPDLGLFDPGQFGLNDLRSDVGFSVLMTEGLLRVDFAKRTDRGRDDWRVTFRILDKF